MRHSLPRHELGAEEARLLSELRALRRAQRSLAPRPDVTALTPGQRIADTVAATMGSWRFIVIQSALLVVWVALNLTAYVRHWDPYPFILLNLALSFQAAYAAPFIMMSQNVSRTSTGRKPRTTTASTSRRSSRSSFSMRRSTSCARVRSWP